MCVGGGGVQGGKIFVNDQSRSLGAPLSKCLEILCAAMPYSAAWDFYKAASFEQASFFGISTICRPLLILLLVSTII